MQDIQYLTDRDFQVVQTNDGKRIMKCMIPGVVLVFFYSKKCPGCNAFDPIFRRLPEMNQGVRFGMVNVSQYPNIVRKSLSTNSKITRVPDLIIYHNQIPFSRFKDQLSEVMVLRFIRKVVAHLQKQFRKNKKYAYDDMFFGLEHGITPGIVKCIGESCFLPMEEAYGAPNRPGSVSVNV